MITHEKLNRRHTWQGLQAFISLNTGLLHLNRGHRPFIKDDLIPIAYNFLYQLLLFRMKERGPIEEALRELNHLLNFQIKEGEFKGNFPVFLHEYPNCERSFEIIFSLFPLYWIAKDFSNLIEPKLKAKLFKALEDGMVFVKKMEEGKEFSYILSLEIAALSYALGQLLDRKDWHQEGAKSLVFLAKRGGQECWGSPRSLSKMLIALHLVENEEIQEQWSTFRAYLNKSWYSEGRSYMGPSLSEHFEGENEEQTLYHLYMERRADLPISNFSPITSLEEELLLGGSPLYTQESASSLVFLGSYQWENTKSDDYAYSFFNLTGGSSWIKTGGNYPLKCSFKGVEQSHSFILQMGTETQIQMLSLNKLHLTFMKQPEQELDIAFFWNLSSQAELFIDGIKASMFQLNQKIEIKFPNHTLHLKFPNPSPHIWGQLMRKNRRSQLIEKDFHFTDGHLYFREVREIVDPIEIEIEIVPHSS